MGGKPNDARRAAFDFPPVDKERAYDIIDAMRPIAQAHDASVARVALAWLLARKGVMSVIIGAKTLEQLDDNLAAAKLELSAEEIAELDRVSALKPGISGLDDRAPVRPEIAAAQRLNAAWNDREDLMGVVRWGVLGVAKIATEKVIPAMQRGEVSRIDAIASRDPESARRGRGARDPQGSWVL